MADRRIVLRKELHRADHKALLKRYANHAGKLLSEVRIQHPEDRASSRQFLIDMIVYYETRDG